MDRAFTLLKTSQILLRNHDIFFRGFDYCEQLLLLSIGNSEFVETLFELVAQGLPFALGDLEVLVRLFHRASGIYLGTAGGLAHNRGNLKFKSCFGHPVSCFLDSRI